MAQYVIATSAGFTVASGNFTHSVGDTFLGATTVTTLSTSGKVNVGNLYASAAGVTNLSTTGAIVGGALQVTTISATGNSVTFASGASFTAGGNQRITPTATILLAVGASSLSVGGRIDAGTTIVGALAATSYSSSGTLDASGLATFASVTITQELQYLKFSGTAQFASGGTQLAVVLGTTLPDANYAVMVSPHFNSYSTTSLYVSGRSVNSFMANVDNATGVTGTARTISYMVLYGSATANP